MTVLWQPQAEAIQASHMKAFQSHVEQNLGHDVDTYFKLHQWSVRDREGFWDALWNYAQVQAETKGNQALDETQGMFKARFFPGARLNYAQNLLRRHGAEDAVIFWGEDQIKRRLSHDDLRQQVANITRAMRALGLQSGDRVAGFVPNTPEALIAMLATTALGAVWSSCSPDFGVEGVLDRFGQIKPKLLFLADGYIYGGKTHNCLDKLSGILEGLPTVERAIVFPYAGSTQDPSSLANVSLWGDLLKQGEGDPMVEFAQVPFNHPLFILYSSGTTGKPKCIVHGAGGTLLQHLKEHQLHCDVKPGDRVFYFTTCGWMMWNWQVSALASGATLMLYDGSPFYPDGNILWDYAQDEKFTLFGTAAKYIDSLHKQGYEPKSTHDLSSLRMMTSTGSPLVPESFDYVYTSIAEDVCLASISGGSDIVSCFVLGNPTAPVYRGEIQAPGLGMDVDVFTDEGMSADVGEKGELVCKQAFPSMPLEFWNDEGDTRYHASYFERFPGMWCHGDFMAKTEHGGYVIHGRSDAILNPGGVRIGTAEIYRQVELLDEVVEGLVIGQEWDDDVRVVLFVRLKDGVELTDELIKKIKTTIRKGASPRHVPAVVLEVADIPRTKSGKIVELAVRDVVHGREVKNMTALANPEALEFFKDREELRA